MIIFMKFSRDVKSKLDIIVAYLKDSGCSKILLFGSLAEGKTDIKSDIDIAVNGITTKKFFNAIAKLPILVKHRVDLIDLDDLPPDFRKSIEKNGIVLYAK